MRAIWVAVLILVCSTATLGGVGDVQTKTDHPWYPGELSCSTFSRLFRTQAEAYRRATGRDVQGDEDRAIASWFWRNTHYCHCTEGARDLWGKGPGQGPDDVSREYWNGLFADGFSLCYATHAQWQGEMQALFGPGRARCCGVPGHTTFEVFLTGGPYGTGRWALLDHDVSTVYFTPDGARLMSLLEVCENIEQLLGRKAEQNRGWLPGGLHPSDPQAYKSFDTAMYAYGYAGAPPIVHLRAGESIRRYPAPGLEDGKTFVYWGINYGAGGIPGPHRDRTWVNQPEKMYRAARDAGSRLGQWYGNAVYTYRPDFSGGSYREAVVDESANHVTLEFDTPYTIGCTPANLAPEKQMKAIYEPGARNGLVILGRATCPVRVSLDRGRTWNSAEPEADRIDLTDFVKGRQHYWLRFDAPARDLARSGVTIRTVCQASLSIIPRLQAGVNRITYSADGLACLSAGPEMGLAEAHVIEGKIGGAGAVTLQLKTPRGERAVHLYAAQRQASGNPPRDVSYNIDCSVDGGRTWQAVVDEMPVIRHDPEPDDCWSQSHVWGDAALAGSTERVLVRFNPAGRTLQRCEAHLVYRVENTSPATVTYAWKDADGSLQTASHMYAAGVAEDSTWTIDAGANPEMQWVEYAAGPSK